ncbi:hypothetical protein FACS1894141_4350 [Spirochaetia bacterium]|nr:hypothetical protein FACS1894141_4350 [Spirochaetia bacterium]
MKKFFTKQAIYSFIAAAAFLAAACTNPIAPPVSTETAVSTPPEMGMVRITVDLWSNAGRAARTIYPDKVFDHYVYTFTRDGELTGEVKTPDTNGVFTLVTGSWTLAVEAYATGSSDSLAATGNSTVFTVSQDTLTDNITVAMAPVVSEGQGTIHYTITYPAGAVLQTLSLVPLGGGGTTDLLSGASTGSGTTTGTKTAVNAGYYLITAALTNAGKMAGRSEVVHIYKDLTAGAAWEFESGDFTEPLSPEATPTVNIDYENEMLTNLVNGGIYLFNGGADITLSDTTYTIAEDWMTGTANGLSIVKKGNGSTTLDSAAQSLTIPARPVISGIAGIQPSVIGGPGGINGTAAGMEYKLEDDLDWTPITGSSVTGLAVGLYAVRIKAAASAFRSEEVSVTIGPFGAAVELTPNADIDYVNETLTNLVNGGIYSFNHGADIALSDTTYTIAEDWMTGTANGLSIVKKGNGSTTLDSAAQLLTIPPRPVVSGLTDIQPTSLVTPGDTGGINGTTTAMEYKLSSAAGWTAITGSNVTGLAAGLYAVRIKATASTFKSEEISITISPFGAAPEVTPNAGIDYANEKLTGLTGSANYTVNGVAKTADASGTIAIESGWFNTTRSLIKKGNGTTTVDSPAQSLGIPARPAAPGLTAIQPAVINGTGGINGTNNGMEYKLTAASGWTPVTGSSITGLAAGLYAVRVKATASTFKSMETPPITLNAFLGTPETKPNAAIDFGTEKLTGLANGNYTIINGGSVVTVSNGTYNIAGLISTSANVPLTIVKKGNGTTTTDSAAQTNITLWKRPAVPSVSGGAEKITGTTALMEYKTVSGGSWANCSASETAVAAGTYVLRVKATSSAFAGVETGTVTVVPKDWRISLSQTGVYTFPAVIVGYGAQTAKSVTITNTGNQATGALTASLSGTNSNSFTLSKTSVSSIAVGGTGTFTVVPKTGLAAGTYAATVTVSGGNGITANFSVSFTVATDLGLYIGTAANPQPNTDTLALALSWLRSNAASNTNYTILLGANENLPPWELGGNTAGTNTAANGKTGITITLRGKDAERVVQLSELGSLITVNTGITLILDENINVKGVDDNKCALIRVGGTLEMRDGAKISGNHNKETSLSGLGYNTSSGGGVIVYSTGTFIMEGGKISGNTDSYSIGGSGVHSFGTFTMKGGKISGNTITTTTTSGKNIGGGGVYISNGTFTMEDGEISENTVTNPGTAGARGGGVYVSNGTFIMEGGKISENTATNANVSFLAAAAGGGVYTDSAYGTATFIMKGGIISGNTATATTTSGMAFGGGVYNHGIFIMEGGTVYGSGTGVNANKLEGSGTKMGVSLFLQYNSTGAGQYGNGAPLIAGDQTGYLYTDDTLMGHN